MAGGFSLRVSPEPVCRQLAVDVAVRYFELVGLAATDAQAAGRAIQAATDDLFSGEGALVLTFRSQPTEVVVKVECGGRHREVRQPLV